VAVDSLWDKTVLLLPLSEDLQDVSKFHRPFAAYGNAGLSSVVGTPFGAGKACYFDGTGDYLRCPVTSADFNLGTGDFDLSAWVYIVGDSAQNGSSERHAMILSVDNESNSASFEFAIGGNASTTGIFLYVWNGTVSYLGIGGGPISKNVWHFIQAIRVSGIVTFYLDGAQFGSSGSYNVQLGSSSQYLHVGGRPITNYNSILNGYIYDARVTKGAARSASLPAAPSLRPTISGHVYDVFAAPVAKTILVRDLSTQKFLGGVNSDPSTGLYTFYPPDFGEVQVVWVDGLFDPPTDECVFDLDPSLGVVGSKPQCDNKGHVLVYNNDPKINADGVSLEFDGSFDSITSTSTDYILGTDDFSIELEFYPVDGGHGNAYARILQIGPNSTVGTIAITAYASTNPLQLECTFYNGSYVHLTGAPVATTFANNTWHKIQVRRVSGVITVTVNDTTWATSGTTAYNISASQLVLGGNTSNTESFNGRIGKVRISRGARRAAAAIPTSRLLKLPGDGGSVENAIIYDRVIPGG
jgi:hypothetical protein